jgi:signal transduction histidine kinase
MALDVLAGAVLLAAAVALRRSRILAVLAALSAVLWFAGDAIEPLVFAHRAPLTQLLLLYPSGRPRSRAQRWAIGTVWVVSIGYPLGALGGVIVLTFALVVLAGLRSRPTTAARRSAATARTGVGLVWGVLAGAAVARAAGARLDHALLSAYEVVVIIVVAAVIGDHWLRRSRGAIVAHLVLDLGSDHARSLRSTISEALGDPSVVLGLETPAGLVDEAGQPVSLSGSPNQVATDLWEGERRIAVLQHDSALQRDRRLFDSVAALAAVALANSRLHQEVALRIAEVAHSRRRLLTVNDAERARLERQLQSSVLNRLATVEAIVRPMRSTELCHQVRETEQTIRLFARGVFPRALREQGLAAVHDLDLGSGRVTVDVPRARFPPDVEAAAYFVCLEAMSNAAKYADATTVRVLVTSNDGRLEVEVADNGTGGADPAKGTGLIGLQDRLHVLGGTLSLRSTSDGTCVRAAIPFRPSDLNGEPARP